MTTRLNSALTSTSKFYKVIVVTHRVQLLLLCRYQVSAVGPDVRALLLLDSEIVGPELLRLLPGDRGVRNALINTLVLILNPSIDLVASRMLHCKIAALEQPRTGHQIPLSQLRRDHRRGLSTSSGSPGSGNFKACFRSPNCRAERGRPSCLGVPHANSPHRCKQRTFRAKNGKQLAPCG